MATLSQRRSMLLPAARRATAFTPAGYVAFSVIDVPGVQRQFTARAGDELLVTFGTSLLTNSVINGISAVKVLDDLGVDLGTVYIPAAHPAASGADAIAAVPYAPAAGLRTLRLATLAFSGVPTVGAGAFLAISR